MKKNAFCTLKKMSLLFFAYCLVQQELFGKLQVLYVYSQRGRLHTWLSFKVAHKKQMH